MADPTPEPKPETVLIAHVTAYLLDGTSFELYPFIDPQDVKAKVSQLVEGWASSGFLLRDAYLVPWHQVKHLEATAVEEVQREEVQARLDAWHAEDHRRALQNFWKTKQEAKGGKEGGDQAEGEQPEQDQGKKGE